MSIHHKTKQKKRKMVVATANTREIFKYSFSNEFKNEMFYFSKRCALLQRIEFKTEFNTWVNENKKRICIEYEKLQQNNYKKTKTMNEFIQKIFESVRYYHRKKILYVKEKEGTEKEGTTTIKYRYSKPFLEVVDNFISITISISKQNNNISLPPHEGFRHFISYNYTEIVNEFQYIRMYYFGGEKLSFNEIIPRLKKCYKNRYYMFMKKNI